MKRCIKWVINWIGEKEWEQIVGFVIAGLLGIALAIICFRAIDTVPATPLDYEQFEEQVNAIQQDPAILLKKDGDIKVKDEIITVEFENDECRMRMTAKYDQNFEVLSTSKEDKSIFWVWALVGALVIAGMEWYFGYRVFSIVVLLLAALVVQIYKILIKIKAILQKQ